MKRLAVVCSAMALLASSAGSQSGHTVSPGSVVVAGQAHWDNWVFSAGTLAIDEDGVRPRYWRTNTNAVHDILENLRFNPPASLKKDPEEIVLLDAVDAGTNREDVVNLFDGDLTTYWEPAPPSGSARDLGLQWWFTVDMGRTLIASKIVLRFVDEDLGDPFQLFDVMVSDGQKPIKAIASESIDFTRVYQTLHPNMNQRVIEIDLANLPLEQRRKRLVRLVQVVVNGSGLEKGREISREEFELLRQEAPGDTGVVEYTKLLSTGGELAVTRGTYDQLEESRRGPVRYFRRERPRLAELEVWSDGDDIFKETLTRGGSFSHTTTHVLGAADLNPQILLDGTVESYLAFNLAASGLHDASFLVDLVADLGSYFWIEGKRMSLNFRAGEHAWTFGGFAIDFSDGTREIDGSLKWERVVENDGLPQRTATSGLIHLYDFSFEPVKARFFRLQYRRAGKNEYPANVVAYVGDMQLIGQGYQPQVELTSDLIQLGGSRNLTTIEWDADTPPGTRVQLQTRTGNTLDTLLHYFKADGTEITEAAYNKIRIKSQKGDIVPEEVAGSDWEPWSEPYEAASGSAITSPSPREFLKIRATLLSGDPGVHATLKSIEVNFSDPVANSLRGQVIPSRVDSLGVERGFFLLVDIEDQGNPFNELLLVPPAGMQLSFDPLRESVFAGSSSLLEEGGEAGNQELDGVVVVASGDSLHLSFPEVPSGTEVVRVDFRGTLYSTGGRLQALLRGSGDGLWQRVDEKVTRTSLQVVAQPERKKLFGELAVNPPVFSPNGDGVNDEMTLDFTLMLVGASTAVEAEIFDLGGRRIRLLEEQRSVSAGAYSIPWDGRDEAGDLVPPGMYAVRLRLGSDTDGSGIEDREVLRTVALTY